MVCRSCLGVRVRRSGLGRAWLRTSERRSRTRCTTGICWDPDVEFPVPCDDDDD